VLPSAQKHLVLTVGKDRGRRGECCLVGQRNGEAARGEGRQRNFVHGRWRSQRDSDQRCRNSPEHHSHRRAPPDPRQPEKYRIGGISAMQIGQVHVPDVPGAGGVWSEGALEKYLLA
jgi:hypothetical protein